MLRRPRHCGSTIAQETGAITKLKRLGSRKTAKTNYVNTAVRLRLLWKVAANRPLAIDGDAGPRDDNQLSEEKCSKRDGRCREGHICDWYSELLFIMLMKLHQKECRVCIEIVWSTVSVSLSLGMEIQFF